LEKAVVAIECAVQLRTNQDVVVRDDVERLEQTRIGARSKRIIAIAPPFPERCVSRA